MNKIAIWINVILPLVYAFLLGVLLTGWLLTKVSPAIFEGLFMIVAVGYLALHVNHEIKREAGD